MSIFIRFLQDNIALVVLTAIAAVVLVASATALIVMAVKRKRSASRGKSEDAVTEESGAETEKEQPRL